MGGTVTITSFFQSPNVLFTFRVLVQKRDATKNLPFMQMRRDLGARPSEGFVLIEAKPARDGKFQRAQNQKAFLSPKDNAARLTELPNARYSSQNARRLTRVSVLAVQSRVLLAVSQCKRHLPF